MRDSIGEKMADQWYHVTPLFLFEGIIQKGGLRCGTDLDEANLPRRPKSRKYDDTPLEQLGGKCLADCILLFRSRTSNLLRDKMESRGKSWKAYPHLQVHFSAPETLKAAGGRLYGSTENVGMCLKNDKIPPIDPYKSYIRINDDQVEEVIIPADTLPDRSLDIAHATCVECFSEEDSQLIRKHLDFMKQKHFMKQNLEVLETLKPKYILAQKEETEPSEYLRLTREFYAAAWSGDDPQKSNLRNKLADRCFD